VHFGGGQSEGALYLEPGEHELCLQPGDGAHIALAPTDRVSVHVAVTSRDEWCDVAGEVDALFTETDNSDDDFAVKQVAYEGTRRLLAQLTDGIDQVDAAVREDVAEMIDMASTLASTVADAPDADTAAADLEALFGAEGLQSSEAGVAWILEECGVDVDS
jgi:hypothetical protein